MIIIYGSSIVFLTVIIGFLGFGIPELATGIFGKKIIAIMSVPFSLIGVIFSIKYLIGGLDGLAKYGCIAIAGFATWWWGLFLMSLLAIAVGLIIKAFNKVLGKNKN